MIYPKESHRLRWYFFAQMKNKLNLIATGLVVLSTVGAGAWAGYSHFQTDSEAATAHNALSTLVASNKQKQLDVFKQDRIDRNRREIKRLEYKLLSEELTIKQVDYIKRQLTELEGTIKCIRTDQC